MESLISTVLWEQLMWCSLRSRCWCLVDCWVLVCMKHSQFSRSIYNIPIESSVPAVLIAVVFWVFQLWVPLHAPHFLFLSLPFFSPYVSCFTSSLIICLFHFFPHILTFQSHIPLLLYQVYSWSLVSVLFSEVCLIDLCVWCASPGSSTLHLFNHCFVPLPQIYLSLFTSDIEVHVFFFLKICTIKSLKQIRKKLSESHSSFFESLCIWHYAN